MLVALVLLQVELLPMDTRALLQCRRILSVAIRTGIADVRVDTCAANCCGHSYKSMTSTCYCASPPDNCGAGYDAGSPTCAVDNSTVVSPTLVYLLIVLV